jgi:hypothetical protein
MRTQREKSHQFSGILQARGSLLALAICVSWFGAEPRAFGQIEEEGAAQQMEALHVLPQSEFLFGLTGQELVELVHFYADGPVDDQVVRSAMRQMRTPFVPGRFGDLNTLVGPDNTYCIIGILIALMRDGVPEQELLPEMMQRIRAAEEDWFHESYPEGVPEDDPFWGTEGGADCEGSSVVYVESGDYRLRVSARVLSLWVWPTTCVKARTYKRQLSGLYLPVAVNEICIDGQWSAERRTGGTTVRTFAACNYLASAVSRSRSWPLWSYFPSTIEIDACGEAHDPAFGTLSACVCHP